MHARQPVHGQCTQGPWGARLRALQPSTLSRRPPGARPKELSKAKPAMRGLAGLSARPKILKICTTSAGRPTWSRTWRRAG